MADAIDLSSMSSLKAATSYTSNSLHEAVRLRIGKQGVAATKPQTIPKFFHECCHKYKQLPALVYENRTNSSTSLGTTIPAADATAKEASSKCPNSNPNTNSLWTTLTFADYENKVKQASLILLHVGLQPHSSIGILASNCPEWCFAELGALCAGGVVAGIYPSNSAEAVYHVLDTSEATVCVVDDAQQMAKVRAIKSRLPRLRAVLQLHGPYNEFVGNDEGFYRWNDLECMEFGNDLKEELELRERDIGANECAMLIYTSGTVGMPKAAMVSHDSVLYDCKSLTASMPNIEVGNEVTVTYLPLNHIAAQLFDIFLSIENGSCVYFADKNALKGTLGKTLVKARPTRIFGVPRIFEKIQEKLVLMESNSSVISKFIMDKARQTVERAYMETAEGKTPSSLSYWIASKVTRQIKYALGFDRCKSFIIGGAPVSEELKRFFMSIDMPLAEVYGMSEASGAITWNKDLRNLQSVGKALDGVELKIYSPNKDGHGEICIRGRTIVMGYLNDIKNTKETIMEDGWLHSGDIGYMDTEGNLVISGRIKELIITSGGENIPPAHIEQLIKGELNCISNAIVVGDHKKYLTVLLTLKTEIDANTGFPIDLLRPETVEWLRSLGLDYTQLSEVLNIPTDIKSLDASNVNVQPHPLVLESIAEGIKRANEKAISNAQRVQKFSILPHDFSIPTGELGPTLKVRRSIILQKYATVIAQMYK